MAVFLSALLALYIYPSAMARALEPHVPDCYRGCLRNTTDVRDDCGIRDTECLCAHDWITKAVLCCLARDCVYKDWSFINKFVMASCEGKVTNIPLGPAIFCYKSWSKEMETAVITITPYTGGTMSTDISSPASTSVMGATITGAASPLTKSNDLSPPVAPFNGMEMFTGSCTSPKIAFASASAEANLTAYPWMGCSQENQNCCAFSGDELMDLTICPQDYTTTASACCPSNWKIYTANLGGQTPCYTSLNTGFAQLPSLADNATFITDLAFTMKYDLTTEESYRLRNGAMAGVIVGAVTSGVCLLGILGHLILRRKRNRRNGAAEVNPSSGGGSLYSNVNPHSPMELPGSTFIHENHPAFSPTRVPQELLSEPRRS